MNKGSPEWFRAKYAAMLVAHLSMTEPHDDTPKDAQAPADEKSNRDERSDNHAS